MGLPKMVGRLRPNCVGSRTSPGRKFRSWCLTMASRSTHWSHAVRSSRASTSRIGRGTMLLLALLLATGFGLASCATGERPRGLPTSPTAVVPPDQFARVNGVTLHYLDWGGTGPLILFLPGLAHTAHAFDEVAPAFTDRYHAMGLTRRANGASEKAATGYDIETLATDIIAFL